YRQRNARSFQVTIIRFPGAAQHEVMRCRPGIVTNSAFLGAECATTRISGAPLGAAPCPGNEIVVGLRRVLYAALFRPHSRAEAISAPSRIDLSLSQTTGSIPHSRRVKVPNPQSVEATTRSRSPTAATASSIRRATTSGCSTKLVVVSITPGTRIISLGSGTFLNAAYSCAWRGLENSID